jgi:plastocyanin
MQVRLALTVLTLAVVAAVGGAPAYGNDGNDTNDGRVPVALNDACDPASFNAVIGPGTCVGSGTVTFGAFIAELGRTHRVATWNFSPAALTVQKGDRLVITNRGGETHTYTEVPQFGFGIVPILNTLTFGSTGPPLAAFATAVFLAPGQTQVLRTTGQNRLALGMHRFECAIHPWMQGTVNVVRDEDDEDD